MIVKAFTLNDRILLYLSAAGASFALYHRGTLHEVHALPSHEEGWEEFNALLLKHADKPVAIAVDTVDEVYRQDILPRVHGADRREMTDRRLRQLIHHSAYRAALRQKALSDPVLQDQLKERRQERYLMMGLTNAEIVRPWLDILHVRSAHLAGIWLLPALAIPLAKQFRLGKGRLLLVSEQTGGLRLTYLEEGELRFSRLAPVDSTQYENPLEGYAEEIERTRQSLLGQRLLARSAPLRTLLLDPLNTLAQLHALLPESAGFQCESILRGQLLETLKLPPTLLAESSDALYLKLLPDAPQSANLMTREQHGITRLHWMKRGLIFISSAWITLIMLISLLLWLDSWRLDHAANQARAASQANREQEAHLMRSAGGASRLDQRRQIVEAWHSINALEHDPAGLFETVLNISNQIGKLHIHRLDGSTYPQQNPDSSPENQAGKVPLIRLAGEILPFDNNFSAAHQRVQTLVAQLQTAFPGQSVSVTQWPLDASVASELEGEFGHSQVTARFQIEIKGATP